MKNFLPIFSYVFHPVFVPMMGTIFFLLLCDDYYSLFQILVLLTQILIITILLPIAFFYLLRTFGKIDSVMLSDVSQRKIPLILQIMLLSVLVVRTVTVDRFMPLHYYFLGGILSSCLAFLLLFIKVKVSIHLIGTSALTLFVMALSYHYAVNILNSVIFLVVINGFVASSRLEMKAHTLRELLYGFIIGAIPQLILLPSWL